MAWRPSRGQETGTPRLRGRAGQRQRLRRLRRTNGLCEMCLEEGRTTAATVVNHKLRLADGGPDTDDNTENLCDDHDAIVTAAQSGVRLDRGVDASGRPTAAGHAWNRSR